MKPNILFHTDSPLTADQLQYLRESFARPTPQPRNRPSLFATLQAAWLARPVTIGLLIFLNLFAALFLIASLTK